MQLFAYTVYDQAVKAYMQPFFVRSKGEALRSFTEACNDQKSNLNKYAADYTLFCVGSFDDGTGMFDSVVPVRVISALECVADSGVGLFTSDNRAPDGPTAALDRVLNGK